jgi:hypothetical protein
MEIEEKDLGRKRGKKVEIMGRDIVKRWERKVLS